MKKLKYSLLLFITLVISNGAFAQYTNNGISTNPQNPVNNSFLPWANGLFGRTFTHNPFLNTFDWGDVNRKIQIPFNTGFNITDIRLEGDILNMKNPFYDGLDIGLSEYSKWVYYNTKDSNIFLIDPKDRDFQWKDGWELIWLNTGKTPDGYLINDPKPDGPLMDKDQPSPNHIPYFVLYNRYKGTIRLFANIWFDNTSNSRYQKIVPTLYFQDRQAVNGLLRHADAFDLALDQKSKIINVTAPSLQPTNQDMWLMSDYQVGFDPCICTRNEAFLKFKFNTILTMDIKMVSRSITVSQNITDNSYLKEDFMNLNDVEACKTCYRAGSRIYKKMDGMLEDYVKALDKYKTDLANYNSLDATISRTIMNAAKDGVSALGGSVGEGIAKKLFVTADIKSYITKIAPRVSAYSLGLAQLDTGDAANYTKSLQSAAKGIIGNGFDFLSTQFLSPDNPPSPPSPPTASFTESSYTGEITIQNENFTQPLIVPGATPNAYRNSSGVPVNPGLNKLNYPAYNEVLGLFALLETPKIEVEAKNKNIQKQFNRVSTTYLPEGTFQELYAVKHEYVSPTTKHNTNYTIKLKTPLKYRFNHVVDFDFHKTKLYYSYRVKFKNKTPNITAPTLPPVMFIKFNQMQSVINNQQIVENDNYHIEYFNGNTSVVTTPFTEVTNMLNEPQFMTNTIDVSGANLTVQHSLKSYIQPYELIAPSVPDNFVLELDNYSQIESIELKLMADMYFQSKGSKGQDLNTLQTFTYQIYKNAGNDNQRPDEVNSEIGNVTFLNTNEGLIKHQAGNIVFENIVLSPATISQYTHHVITGNEVHVWVENAILKQNVSVAAGYTAYIHFVGNAVSNAESAWIPELVLDNMKSEDLYNNPFVYEATNEEVNQFCNQNTNKYKANTSLSKTSINNESVTDKDKQENKFTFRLYPNPSNDKTTVLYQLTDDVITHVGIYNIAGELVQSMAINGNEITNNQVALNTQGLSAGIYFVTLSTSNNQSVTQKLVIAK